VHGPETSRTDDTELAALRDAFPGYRFRRRFVRGVLCYLAEARAARPRGPEALDVPLAAARSPAVLADMLAAATGRPVRLRAAAVAAACSRSFKMRM
jgi:hypothetical protein